MPLERILILDNDAPNLLFFEMVFQDLGLKPTTAPTGDEALKIVKRDHIQMVVTAWELQGMPGTVFVQKARAARNRKFLPCLIFSKRMSEEDVLLTKELGFDDILQMPCNKDAAAEAIKTILDRENNLHPIENKIRKMDNYISNGQPQEALKLLTRDMYKSDEFKCRVHTMAARIWMAMGKIEKAQGAIEVALEAQEDDVKALQVKARILSRQGNHDDAINLLTELQNKSPKNMSTRVGLGSAYVSADRHEEAKQVFSGISEIDPDFQPANDEHAILAFKEGDISLAEQLIAETDAGDELASIFNNMAIGQINNNKFDDGISTYHKAMNLLADKARTHLLNYNLALAFKKKGDLGKAFEYFCQSYILSPDYEKAYNSLAHTAKTMKEKAIKPDKNLVQKVKEVRRTFKPNEAKKAG